MVSGLFAQLLGGFLTFLVHCINLVLIGSRCVQISWNVRRQTSTPNEVLKQADFSGSKLSVVIPARNEEKQIETTLRSLTAAAARPDLLEIVLVDSNCTDTTMELAEVVGKSLPCTLRLTKAQKKGRGGAMDAGTDIATGEIIMVLHSDSVAPRGFDDLIRGGLSKPGAIATCFHFEMNPELLDGPLPGRIVANFMINIKTVLLRFPFGDQGWALPAARLKSYGGWNGQDYPLMEDFRMAEFVRRDYAKGFGHLELLPGSTACNPRRWAAHSVWRVNLINQMVIFFYITGLTTPSRLFEFYYGGLDPQPFTVEACLKTARSTLLSSG